MSLFAFLIPNLAEQSSAKRIMLKLHDIVLAQQRLSPYLQPTPLIYSEALSERSGAKVWLKLECRQPTGSFKVRGALSKLMALGDEVRDKGVVAASAGNHGLGVAYAAKALGLNKTTIFVPCSAPTAKVTKLARFPIHLHQVGETYEDAHQAAEAFAQNNGAIYLPAYDDPQVIAGAGTCGLEIMTILPEVETIIVPVGGGGLVAGVAVAAIGINPACQIVGVQPEASPAAKLSFEQNRPIDPYDHAPTIADGLAGGFGVHPFYIARTMIDKILLFSETELRRAVFTLIDQEQLVVEASGAIAIAPLLAGGREWQDQTIVCILSGANIDCGLLADILNSEIARPRL
jgi:threonine dehydratase